MVFEFLNDEWKISNKNGGIAMQKREVLYGVGIQHIKTGEKINLEVWAENIDKATHGLRGVICYNTMYRWIGTSPLYENNNVISRMVDTKE